MTVKSVPSHKALTQLFEGLSSDTKPSVNVESYALFIENDTGTIYQYTGATWQIYTRSIASSLLQGNGDFLLQGNGDKILLG